MTRASLFAAVVVLGGCSRPAAESVPPAPPELAAPVVVVTEEGPAGEAREPVPGPGGFEYPGDRAGRLLARAAVPEAPAVPPVEWPAIGPVRRVPPAVVLSPEPPPGLPARPALPPVLPVSRSPVRPLPPPERVPWDLGWGAAAVPARPTFPVAAGITTRAPDVSRPPPLPPLGRPFTERVSLDDPTAELGHAAITTPPVRVAVEPAGFLKATLPDPFELAEQVRPHVLPAAEPGLTPVVVPPQRIK